jgi:hypothetical protein
VVAVQLANFDAFIRSSPIKMEFKVWKEEGNASFRANDLERWPV